MLISTRGLNESIYIGDNIRIKILEIKRQQVKLAIEAPRDITIYREETYQRTLKLGNNLPLETSMLVIGRLEDEAIMISDYIEIKIEAVKGNKVIVAISAPRDIPVCRKEYYEEQTY